jgi:hypothetical protein
MTQFQKQAIAALICVIGFPIIAVGGLVYLAQNLFVLGYDGLAKLFDDV